MNLPRLLQRLGQSAHSKDARGVREALVALAAHRGWASSVQAYIDRMSGHDNAFVQNVISPPMTSLEAMSFAGSPMGLGGTGGRVGTGGGMASVTQDATSLKYCPATAGEWTTTMAAAGIGSGGPSILWLLQEAAGNAADSIGSFTGTVAGTVTYQSSVTGWTRKGMLWPDDGVVGGVVTTSASLADPATTSGLLLTYVKVTTPSVTRNMLECGSTNRLFARITATPVLEGLLNTTVDGTSNPTGAVRPFVSQWNATTSAATVASDQDTITPGWLGLSGKRVSIGSTSAMCPGTFVYSAFFSGAAAELTSAQLRTLLQTLGWTIAW